MANIYKRGKTWWGRARKGGTEHRRSLGTASRSVAEKRLQRWLDDLDAIKFGESPRRTFDDAAEHFLINHCPTLKPQSQRRYRTSMRMLILHGDFRGQYLDTISRDRLAAYEQKRRGMGASAPTIRRDLACLSSLFEQAIQDWDLEIANPVSRFMKARRKRGLTESPPRTRYLSHAEERAVLNACRDYMQPLAAFSIDTGLRLEEQLSLTWSQLDLVRGIVTVTGDVSKTGRIRQVPLNDRARTILGTLPRHLRSAGQADWVFCKRDGSRYGKLTRGLASAAERAGVKDLKWHDFRRTCGCRLIQDHGYKMDEVRDWLGHASVVQTERAYAFLTIDNLLRKNDTRTKTGTQARGSQAG